MNNVWVVVLGWNKGNDTLECLHSLESNDSGNGRVVLVDNASTDGTVVAVQEKFPNVHIIENNRNLGFAEGNNIGIRYALEQGADFVFLLNNDAMIEKDCLGKLIQAARENPHLGMVCTAIASYYDRSKIYIGTRIYWGSTAVVDLERSPEGLPQWIDTDFVPGCALLVRTEVIKKIGLFDPDFFAYYEDVDWSLRCRRAGYGVAVVPGARVYHKGAMDQSENKSPSAFFYFFRNQFLFNRKHARWYHWLAFIKYSTRQVLLRLHRDKSSGQMEIGNAMLDGWWAGLIGRFGAERVQAPIWFRNLITEHLNTWLWLTSWLYFWDHQKVKRARAKRKLVSS